MFSGDENTINLPPLKSGPIRPEPSHPRPPMNVKFDGTAPRTIGAKRVLRPEPTPGDIEKLTNTKGPIRPLTQDCPVSVISADAASVQTVSKVSTKLSVAKTARSTVGPFQQRLAKDTASHSSSFSSTIQPVSDKPINVGDGKETRSRLTKPTVAQLARESLASQMVRRKTEATKPVKEHLKKPKKLGATAMAEDTRATTPASLSSPTLVRNTLPVMIPLPPSPPADLAPTSHEQLVPETDKGTNEPSRSILDTQLDSSPELTTPKAGLKAFDALAVEQTPISALVDSIRNGFVFAPEYPNTIYPNDNDDDLDHTFIAQDCDSQQILPLNWARRAAPVSNQI
jgi:hypothetical protein